MTAEIPDDPRLVQATQEYLEQLEAGRKPDHAAFLSRYPDLKEPLAACLDGLDLLRRANPNGLRSERGAAASIASPADVLPGTPIGDFQIVGEIGRGGMGIVYEAVQLSLGRRVALKVLPFAATFDPKQLQRFQNEARAAAQLHHTNIVPVYAVGCERGIHFYAMQLIKGHSLAQVIQQLRQAVGRAAPEEKSTVVPALTGSAAGAAPGPVPQGSTVLSTQRANKRREFFRTIARSVVQAAEALDYAHHMGVVHRDIKPGNLLIDELERLWVTDFGLAQFHSEDGLTQTGDVLGTLRYMSPEQAAGRWIVLDHRSDIYSLGATLYELATLEPLFPGRNRQELLQQVLHEEPRPPRAVEPTVPVELETIILKAVSKDPGDRYATSKDLAADLGRFLDDKPVLARRPSLFERARKWSRRHPSMVGAALVILLLVTGGLLVNNRMITLEQARTADRARDAEDQFRLARRSVDELIQIADEELADNPQMEGLRKRLLDSALTYYQEFIAQRRKDPKSQADLEATRDRVKKILADLASLQGAGQHYLLGEASVLEDLGLSPDQRSRMKELMQSLSLKRDERFRESGRMNPEERSRRARADEASVAQLLSPEQLARLGQIALQSEGPPAFFKPDVAAALKLTAEQKESITTIAMETYFGRNEGRRPWPSEYGSPEKTFTDRTRSAMDRIQAQLSDVQRKRWNELMGEPFKGVLPVRFKGPPGLGGPPAWIQKRDEPRKP
jgi:hypothetical protein